MKRILPLFLIAIALATPAHAANTVAIKSQSSIFEIGQSEGFSTAGKISISLNNFQSSTSDIVITAVDLNKQTVWMRTIDSGADEVGMAVTSDSSGNFWIAGAASALLHTESATTTNGADNPDGVVVDSPSVIRPDMTAISLWKISPGGEVIATYQLEVGGVPLVNSLSVASTGVSAVGSISDKSFLITSTLTGQFGVS